MAALTADRSTLERLLGEGVRHDFAATAGVQFYKGGMVAMDVSTGLLIKATTGTPGDYVVGRCEENKLTVSGDTVRVKIGTFKYANAGDVTAAMRGKLCYVSDDQTVTEDSATNTPPPAGTVFEVDSDGVWVTTYYPHPAAVALNPS